MVRSFFAGIGRTASRMLPRLWSDCRGNTAVIFAIAALPVAAAVGAGVDYSRSSGLQARMQASLDASLLAGLRAQGQEIATAQQIFTANFTGEAQPATSYVLNGNTLKGSAEAVLSNVFGGVLNSPTTTIRVRGSAIRTTAAAAAAGGPCIYVLDPNASQALLVNSGPKIQAPDCEVHVHSKQNPAAIFNAGTTLNVKRFCIAGTNIIKNTSASLPIELGCAAQADPFAGKLPTPTAGSCSNSKQVYDPPQNGTHVMPAGSTWCSVIFNGSPKIVFQPGLHIIKGSMIINSGAKVVAEGVTFYFPDTDSQIQANGNLTMTATAPTSGTYKGVLMFEKTSSAANNANKRNYVFNGSSGEKLEGIVYLPNRDVTYNSTTNIGASKFSLVVNSLIVNSANWSFSGLSGGGGDAEAIYLSR